ncbi:MAG: thermonuclease family protein [Chloroflexi bacterium]|nr:thermonuclease family protein [Chloroflexota bacterium]
MSENNKTNKTTKTDETRAAAQADAAARELRRRLSPWQWGVLLIIAGILAAGFGVDIFRLPELQELLPITTPITTPLAAIPPSVPDGALQATLVRVVDGDTIEVTIGGQALTVRYVGIDTPERGEPGYKAAAAANQELLGSGTLWLAPDRTDKDRYGRLLRFIYTDKGVFVNQEMIAQGWAQPLEFKPDVTLAVEFRKLATEAAEAKRGFWSGSSDVDGAMPYALVTQSTPLRIGPGRDFDTTVSLLPGLTMSVYARDESGRWLQIRTPDRAGGWVSASAVELNVPVGDVPKGE